MEKLKLFDALGYEVKGEDESLTAKKINEIVDWINSHSHI